MASEPTPSPTVLSPETAQQKLNELGSMARICIAQARGAEHEFPEVQISETEQPELWPDPHVPDPEYALRHAQWRLASERSADRAYAARDFVAWWASSATHVVFATANGSEVDSIAFDAGNPSRTLTDEQLDHLAQLVLAEGDGDVVYLTDGHPVRRREQLWGEDWAAYGVPRLPSLEELMELLERGGVPRDEALQVGQARQEIADALAAARQVSKGTDDEELADSAERLTDLLAEYAQRLTDIVLILRLFGELES